MEIENVSFEYECGKPIISNFSLCLPLGARVALMGESGRGKTTLVRLMLGLIRPTEGKIEYDEGEKLSVVFQEDRLLPWVNALQNVAVVSNVDAAAAALDEMELAGAANMLPGELSGGMQRRVAIARALAFGGNVLLLDEPFKGLDDELKRRVASVIDSYAVKNGASIVLVTHDANDACICGCTQTIRM